MMKKIVFATALITACATVQCVNGPVTVEEEHTVPAKAIPVTIENVDSLMAVSGLALVEFYSEKCPVCASLAWTIDTLHSTFE